jgi:hypothetical protein
MISVNVERDELNYSSVLEAEGPKTKGEIQVYEKTADLMLAMRTLGFEQPEGTLDMLFAELINHGYAVSINIEKAD